MTTSEPVTALSQPETAMALPRRRDPRRRDPRRRDGQPAGSRSWLVVLGPVLAGLLATGLVCETLFFSGGLTAITQYDDGVYFGAAVRLVGGTLPYRDFVFVQPPGIAVILAPVAFLTHAAGTRVGLEWARGLTAVVVGLDVVLVGRLLRYRGAMTATIASLVLAVFPAAFFADRTVLLEPYLVGLCLAGLNVCFVGGELGGRRRLFLGGLLLGAAGATKTWAVVVVAALCIAALGSRSGGATGRARAGAIDDVTGGRGSGAASRILPLVGGTGLGFAIICAPFFLAAPGAFVRDVVTAQLARATGAPTSLWHRLAVLVGLHGVAGVIPSEGLTFAISAALVLLLVAFGVVPVIAGQASRLERFALLATAGSIAAVLVPHEFYDHYAYFTAAFLALSLPSALFRAGRLGVRLVAAAARWRPRGAEPGRAAPDARARAAHEAPVRTAPSAGAAACVAAALVLAGLLAIVPSELRYQSAAMASAGDPARGIDIAVPRGACALSDAAIFLVEADRLTSSQQRCPKLLDGTALWLVTAPGKSPQSCAPVDPALVADWRDWLSRADFFVESPSANRRVPWTVALLAWFHAHYRYLPDPGVKVFVHLGTSYSSRALAPARWTAGRLAAEGWHPVERPAGTGPHHPVESCLAHRI